MRIGLDISICTFNKAGSARYACSLLKALQKRATEESVTVIPLSVPLPFEAVAPGIKRKAVTLFWEVAYAPLWLPALARYHQLDVLHLTVPMPIGKFHCPVVTMIHDLIPILFPQWFSFIMGVRLRRWIRHAAQHSTHLLTNSDCTAGDLKEHVKPDVPITTTYLGSYLDFPTAPHRTKENLSLVEDAPYILSVGTLEPRKNLRTVLDAYHLLQDRVNNPPNLMVVGATGWMADDVHGRAEQLGIADRVKLTGFVTDEQLQALYEQATMLVYPSLYEGFGIPPLEAMSSGCPVITSNVSSLPEVVGEAGILIDPTDANALANAMQNLLTDPAQASLLREKGYQQAARFSWERCAQETLGVYREVMKTTTF